MEIESKFDPRLRHTDLTLCSKGREKTTEFEIRIRLCVCKSETIRTRVSSTSAAKGVRLRSEFQIFPHKKKDK